MSGETSEKCRDHQEIADFVAEKISSALANHLGGVELIGIEEDHFHLRMTASCSTCYFRRGCIDSLVIPEIRDRFGTEIKVTVR